MAGRLPTGLSLLLVSPPHLQVCLSLFSVFPLGYKLREDRALVLLTVKCREPSTVPGM